MSVRCNKQLIQWATLVSISLLLSGCVINQKAVESFLLLEGRNADLVQEYCGAKEHLDMSNITYNIWWPGCGLIQDMAEFGISGESSAGRCAKHGCINMQTMQEMNEFNKRYGGQRVSYKSRPGKDQQGKPIERVDLGGWWLPAPGATASTPRIVLQHGFTSNSNKFRTMFIAFLLRKMGYSVLVNNLRDHCYSANSTAHMIEWGHAYPYDVLGAWDYARSINPPIPPAKVGILGISMGGFNTLNAFGLDPQIPAVWIDGAPYTAKGGFELPFKNGVKEAGVGFLAGALIEPAWKAVVKTGLAHGINVNEHLPEQVLPTGPDTQRLVFVTANIIDNTVAFSNSQSIVTLLKAYPAKYTVAEFWVNNGGCLTETHSTDMMIHTEEYAEKLKQFWGRVFQATTGAPMPVTTTVPTASYGMVTPPARRYEEHTGMLRVTLPTWPVFSLLAVFVTSAVVAIRFVRIRASRGQSTDDEIRSSDEARLLIPE